VVGTGGVEANLSWCWTTDAAAAAAVAVADTLGHLHTNRWEKHRMPLLVERIGHRLCLLRLGKGLLSGWMEGRTSS
jgi:hypothetical protein